jgi:hypothetical protein
VTKPTEALSLEAVRAYYEGVSYSGVVARILTLTRALAALDDDHALKRRYGAAAKTLWGGEAGDPIDPELIARVLFGDNGIDYARAWIFMANSGDSAPRAA